MNRLCKSLVAAAILVMTAVAPAAAAAETYQLGIDARFAQATWGRFDATSGDSLQVTIVEGTVRSRGWHMSGKNLLLSHAVTSGCDAEANCSYSSSINVEATDVNLSIDPALRSAWVDADVTGTQCVISNGLKDCAEVTIHVAIRWSATERGTISHGAGGGSEPASFAYSGHGVVSGRPASATGTLDEAPLGTADLLGATMELVRSGHVMVYVCPRNC